MNGVIGVTPLQRLQELRTVLSLIGTVARADPALARDVLGDVRQTIADEGLWLYEERAWPLFDQALADLRADPEADLFDTYLLLFDSERATRDRLRDANP